MLLLTVCCVHQPSTMLIGNVPSEDEGLLLAFVTLDFVRRPAVVVVTLDWLRPPRCLLLDPNIGRTKGRLTIPNDNTKLS